MKSHVFSIGLLAALAVSCSIHEIDFKDSNAFGEFYACIENTEVLDTKVYATEDLYLRWNADDRITIFNKYTYNQEYRFNGETGDNSGSFRRVDNGDFVTGNSLDNIYAIYPYQESTRISDTGVITVTLPAEQTYAENTMGLGANTMISATTDNQLMFKNACGYLMLKLYGNDATVSTITLKGNNGERIAGKATITMPINGVPAVEMSETAGQEITLVCETPVKIGSTAETATTFWIVVPPTVFNKGFTLTLRDDQNGVFEKTTTNKLEISRNTLSKMSVLKVEIDNKDQVGVVDLGLRVKWASSNIGAATPEAFGGYYAWGEIETKKTYEADTYKWAQLDGNSWKHTKYVTKSYMGYQGFTDGKTMLEPEDDVAFTTLGDGFYIPTVYDWEELMDEGKCKWEWTSLSGKNGYLVTSKINGNSIFFPASGCYIGNGLDSPNENGYYWASSLSPERSYPYRVFFSSDSMNSNADEPPYKGRNVRPVYGNFHPVESISFEKTQFELYIGTDTILNPIFTPEDATIKTINWWESNNPSVASVFWNDGRVVAKSKGTATISCRTLDGDKTASYIVTVTDKPTVPEMIDMGLSVKWASLNLGANQKEDVGTKYAWGELRPKESYSWSNYKWCNGSSNTLTKYCFDSSFGIVDYESILEISDDAAHDAYGGEWRVPTLYEIEELANSDNCSWTWTSINGVYGYEVLSKITGNSIFLPVTNGLEQGHYHSSSLMIDQSIISYGNEQLDDYTLFFDSSNHSKNSGKRYSGISIRAVNGKIPFVESLTLDNTTLTIPVGRTKTIVATVLPENAADKYVFWNSSDPSIATVSKGTVTAISPGSCTITATTHNGGKVESCSITVTPKSDPSFYSSTDFSMDGEVVCLQKSTVGKGINIILMGDGFVDTDMVSGGKYEQRMRDAMEQFFSYEPYKSFRDRFNVYYVRVVSTNREYGSELSDRKLTYEEDGYIYFRLSTCDEYATRVPNPYNQPLKIAVLFNIDSYLARSFCNMSLTTGHAISFIMDTEDDVINHELGGHGFAFLADEYEEYGNNERFTEYDLLDQRYSLYGFGSNVDWKSDESIVKWSRFLSDNRYSDEGLGIYEGAYLYPYGIYRSTKNSVMRNHYLSNGKAYNAPSREQIYKTIMRYSVGNGWDYDYETFVRSDAAGREQAERVFSSYNGYSGVVRQNAPKRKRENHLSPVFTEEDIKVIGINQEGNIRMIK